jgi:hypothetical protein
MMGKKKQEERGEQERRIKKQIKNYILEMVMVMSYSYA